MKEGWSYKKLGEVATYVNGFPFKPSDWTEQGKPIIRIQNLTGTQCKFNRCIRTDIPEKYLVQKGDILISWSATLGVFEWTSEEALLNQHIFKVIFDKMEICKQYFRYAIIMSISEMSRHTNGATMKHIRKGDFDNIKIPLPPLSEQHSIVTRLDAAFSHIDALKANAEKQLSEAKALFQKALAEEMKPKEGWEEKKLGEICEIKSILIDPTLENYKNLLHVGGANIISESGQLIDLKSASEEGLTSGKFTFDENDVLYNKIRPYLIKVARPNFAGLCSADMYPLTPKDEVSRDFLYYILISRDFTDYAILNSGRAGMPKVNRQALFAYKCKIPSLADQQAIVTRLDALSSQVRNLEKNCRKTLAECDALKQAMLREVFE